MSKTVLCLALAVLAGTAQAQEATPVKSPPPSGASPIQENYEDWRLICNVAGGAKQCTILQVQTDTKTGQRVLAVELNPKADGGVSGNLVLPLGLQVDVGVTLALDAGTGGKPTPYRTCLPGGCLVPIAFDRNTVTFLKAGKQLKLTAKPATENAMPLVLTVSLKGFASTFDRAVTIMK